MIEQQGWVVDARGGTAWVETQRQSSCGDCAARSGCGTSLLNRSLGARFNRVPVENSLGAKTGDCVILGIPEQALLKGSFAIYVIPMLLLLIGALSAHLLADDAGAGWRDLSAFVGGALGFAGGLYWARRIGEGGVKKGGFQPVLLRRVSGHGQSVDSIDGWSGPA